MKTFDLFGLALLLMTMFSCKPNASQEQAMEQPAVAPQSNWTVLFDGTSLDAWKGYLTDTIGSAWKIEDGALTRDVSQKDAEGTPLGGGDLITREDFDNFVMELEWKIATCGNSGILFGVIESPEYAKTYFTGPEMQVLDNSCHPDAKIPKHRAGDLYDLIACREETVKPAGEWNAVRMTIDQGKGVFNLNGTDVVQFDMNNPSWQEMIAGSKFHEWHAFGTAKSGKIALQDHDEQVWFRNIRIRRL
ncbi:MAG: DUF1080 domain-containing protein [Saprospiraceae bacterium]|nr:DUF1080 domain-containing protein [Saprospiraceae bacterium]